ncbi:MAG: serine/threonine-protein phosphatase, partial [Bacteroidales bacterium]|nr:serine/threonine-protein phosphatase [Bacteroidales bacterium]
MGEFGLLLVVADGMGGMNAGEVASQIAIDTVKVFFAPGKITKKIASDDSQRQAYLEKVIVSADEQVKLMASQREDRRGMGSTLILVWLVRGKVTVSWIGDSRAYRYNPSIGLQPLSKDHSFVQELVDSGQITYEQAFDHPQGNIVTRSLGDTSKKAKPETRHYKVYDGDVLLLCSDGLSGVLRDSQMQSIIEHNQTSPQACREVLWEAARRAQWYDNVTALICAVHGGDECPEDAQLIDVGPEKPFWQQSIHITKRSLGIFAVVICAIIAAAIIFLPKIIGNNDTADNNDTIALSIDTVISTSCDAVQESGDVNAVDDGIGTSSPFDITATKPLFGGEKLKPDDIHPAPIDELTKTEEQAET